MAVSACTQHCRHYDAVRPALWESTMGINQGTYNIWDNRGLGLPQAIFDAKQGNYDLMLLTETNTPDVVYCRKRLGCDVVFSKATFAAVGVSQGGFGVVS